jgi:hypothetical protein
MDLVPKSKAKLFNSNPKLFESNKGELLNPHIKEVGTPKFGDLDVVYDYVGKRWIIGVKK